MSDTCQSISPVMWTVPQMCAHTFVGRCWYVIMCECGSTDVRVRSVGQSVRSVGCQFLCDLMKLMSPLVDES